MTRHLPTKERRNAIVVAALKIIAEQGLGRFTAMALAREIGTTDAALFHHFRTKQDIVMAAIDRVEEVLFEGFPPVASDPLERLGFFFQQRVAVIERNPGISTLLMSDQLAQAAPPEGEERVREFRRRSQGFVRACLREAWDAGRLAPDLCPDEAAIIVLGSLMALNQMRSPKGDQDVHEMAPRIWQKLLGFLEGRPSR